MLGVLVNIITVILGTATGLLLRKGISPKISDSAMIAIGLCNICIGVQGMAGGGNPLILIVAMVVGTLIGTSLDIDGRFERLSQKLVKRLGSSDSRFAEGFINASLILCVGSMTILGGLNAGLSGDNTLYYTKAVLDFVSSAMLASALGIGVGFGALTVLIYQGGLVLLASLLSPFLTDAVITELNCVGSVMILALGLNLAGVSKFKVADFLPAIIITPIVCVIRNFI
ncbi:MAG: DUF554 domain-containing protein [Clostridia bacterium]|nr:DUF554 domain-containing protein [Clostridia bacterium]